MKLKNPFVNYYFVRFSILDKFTGNLLAYSSNVVQLYKWQLFEMNTIREALDKSYNLKKYAEEKCIKDYICDLVSVQKL